MPQDRSTTGSATDASSGRRRDCGVGCGASPAVAWIWRRTTTWGSPGTRASWPRPVRRWRSSAPDHAPRAWSRARWGSTSGWNGSCARSPASPRRWRSRAGTPPTPACSLRWETRTRSSSRTPTRTHRWLTGPGCPARRCGSRGTRTSRTWRNCWPSALRHARSWSWNRSTRCGVIMHRSGSSRRRASGRMRSCSWTRRTASAWPAEGGGSCTSSGLRDPRTWR